MPKGTIFKHSHNMEGEFMPGGIRIDDVHTIAKTMGVSTRSIVDGLLSSINDTSKVGSDGVDHVIDYVDR